MQMSEFFKKLKLPKIEITILLFVYDMTSLRETTLALYST